MVIYQSLYFHLYQSPTQDVQILKEIKKNWFKFYFRFRKA